MTDRPIIFSAPMVRALLDGRKSQTRRLLKLAGRRPDYIGPKGCTGDPACWGWDNGDGGYILADRDPSDKFAASWRDFAASYAAGDRLWCREVWGLGVSDHGNCPRYRATMDYRCGDKIRSHHEGPFTWRSPIHMPRWASRLTLIVTNVRVQRLHDISAADAIAEGCHVYASSATIDCDTPDPRQEYRRLWNSLHGPDAWDANPWVAALTFTVHRQNIDQMEPTND